MGMADAGDQGSDPEDKDKSDDDSDDGQSGTDISVQLINTTPLQVQVPIDEPVTSGNDGPGGPL